MTLEELKRRARSLPPEDREELTRDLIDSLAEDRTPPLYDQEWDQEAIRRYHALRDGKVELLEGDEVFEAIIARRKV